MKKFLQKIWASVQSLWEDANEKAKKFIPVAVKIVEGVKNFNESGSADFFEFVITSAIPGDADNVVVKKGRAFIKDKLPSLLIELKIINSIADLTDDNEKLRAILNELKLSSTNGIIFKGVAGKALELLSDGKFDFNDSVDLTTFWFKQMQEAKADGSAAA